MPECCAQLHVYCGCCGGGVTGEASKSDQATGKGKCRGRGGGARETMLLPLLRPPTASLFSAGPVTLKAPCPLKCPVPHPLLTSRPPCRPPHPLAIRFAKPSQLSPLSPPPPPAPYCPTPPAHLTSPLPPSPSSGRPTHQVSNTESCPAPPAPLLPHAPPLLMPPLLPHAPSSPHVAPAALPVLGHRCQGIGAPKVRVIKGLGVIRLLLITRHHKVLGGLQDQEVQSKNVICNHKFGTESLHPSSNFMQFTQATTPVTPLIGLDSQRLHHNAYTSHTHSHTLTGFLMKLSAPSARFCTPSRMRIAWMLSVRCMLPMILPASMSCHVWWAGNKRLGCARQQKSSNRTLIMSAPCNLDGCKQ